MDEASCTTHNDINTVAVQVVNMRQSKVTPDSPRACHDSSDLQLAHTASASVMWHDQASCMHEWQPHQVSELIARAWCSGQEHITSTQPGQAVFDVLKVTHAMQAEQKHTG